MIWQDMSEYDKQELISEYNKIKHSIKKLNSQKANKEKIKPYTEEENKEYNNKVTELQSQYNNFDIKYHCDFCNNLIDISIDKLKELFKGNNKPIFCNRICSGKYYANKSHMNKTKEQEQERANKISSTLKQYNNSLTTQEKQDKYGKGIKSYWNNIDQETRSQINKSKIPKIKETKLKRYGNENYNNSNETKQTNLIRYGVENTLRTEKAKNNAKQVMQEKYNVDYFFCNRDIFKQISLDKYGVAHPMKNEEIKQKLKDTKLYRHGDINYNNYEKARQTCLKRYGTTSSFNIKKSKYTKIARYNDPNYNNREQAMKTIFERYGKDYYKNKLKYIGARISKVNKEFAKFADITDFEFPINTYSYDLKKNDILIEIDPTFTHNCLDKPLHNRFGGLDSLYHYNKSIIAKEHGYRCIHIFDWDDWNKILYIIQDKETLYARNLEIKLVDIDSCDDFLNHYHIQNTCRGQEIRLGLYYKDELVEIMTFGKPRYNKNYQYELLRLCIHKDYKVVGGSEKLFKYFINTFKPHSIISYCDFSKFDGDVYTKLGFIQRGKLNCSKHWSKGNKHITDNLLRQRGYDQLFGTSYGKGTSNEQLMLDNGWLPICDAGQMTFIWRDNK